MLKRTYVDSGVLIANARGIDDISLQALNILNDPERDFLSSIFVKLEILTKAVYHKNADEVDFYEAFFASVSQWAEVNSYLFESALNQGYKAGIAALDSLYVASALSLNAEEIITTEKPNKLIHRAIGIKVVCILPEYYEVK